MINLFLLVTFIGGWKTNEIKDFIPPIDNKITQQMAVSYVKAAVSLNKSLNIQSKRMEKFAKRWNIGNPDFSKLNDSTYCADHPEVLKAWRKFWDQWDRVMNKSFAKAGISEKEFDWIFDKICSDEKSAYWQIWIEKQIDDRLTENQ